MVKCCSCCMCCYQIPWFKITKLLLTILRAILFCVFMAFIAKTSYFPTASFIAIFFYNIRLCVALIIAAIIITLLILACLACMCGRDDKNNVNNAVADAAFATIFIGLVSGIFFGFFAIFWKYGDWFCCSKYRYAAFIFDAVHFGLLMIATPIIGGVDLGVFGPKMSDQAPFNFAIIVFFMYTILFGAHLAIEIYRLVQARKIDSRLRHIFKSEESIVKKAKSIFSEALCDTKCFYPRCNSFDPEHCIKTHPSTHIFKADKNQVAYGERGRNYAIGFHQTSIDSVKMIIRSFMIPSKQGWFGQGIYFANNMEATNRKSRNLGGAIICAKIDLGRIKIVHQGNNITKQITLSSLEQEQFDSVYFEDPRGAEHDEFTIADSDRIVEYVVMVTYEALDNYKEPEA